MKATITLTETELRLLMDNWHTTKIKEIETLIKDEPELGTEFAEIHFNLLEKLSDLVVLQQDVTILVELPTESLVDWARRRKNIQI